MDTILLVFRIISKSPLLTNIKNTFRLLLTSLWKKGLSTSVATQRDWYSSSNVITQSLACCGELENDEVKNLMRLTRTSFKYSLWTQNKLVSRQQFGILNLSIETLCTVTGCSKTDIGQSADCDLFKDKDNVSSNVRHLRSCTTL